jgi:hypothetical protein
MLYAARAALSEEERNARTHGGTWQLFRETFVDTGRFEGELAAAAQATQPLREGADYDARRSSLGRGRLGDRCLLEHQLAVLDVDAHAVALRELALQ